MSLRFTRLALALLIAAPLVTAPAPASADPAAPAASAARHTETYALSNGLRVILDEDHRAPLVAISVLYRAGRGDEPSDRHGLGEVITRVLEGASTRHLPRDEVRTALFKSFFVQPFWARTESFTDYSTVNLTVPPPALPLALWIESDRMGFFEDGLSLDQIDKARRAAETTQQRFDVQPFGPALAAAEATLFGASHPYARSFALGKPALSGLTVAEVRAHVQRLYHPGNATLVVSGDLAPAAVKPLIALYFGSLAAAPRVAEVEIPRPALTSAPVLDVQTSDDHGSVLLAWPTPPYFEEDDRRLDLVARVLEARLARRLVRELHVAESVGARERSLHRGSVFTVTLRLAAASKPDEAIRLIDAELTRLRASAPSDAEVASARDGMVVSLVGPHDSVTTRAKALATFDFNSGGPDGLARALASYASIDGEALLRAARQYLPLDRRVVIRGSASATAPRSPQPEEEN